MNFTPLSTNPSDYVVIDVETNGLRCKEHDLLSIALFMPDSNKSYERYLPLELNTFIPSTITNINGITKSDTKEKLPLTQDEVDDLIIEFELDKRVLLHYGDIDEKFIKHYFKRHNLNGFQIMKFYNFKHLFCAKWSRAINLSKDNLCSVFEIEGVSSVHNSLNDCVLEWKLFSKLNGVPVLVEKEIGGLFYYSANKGYIVPITKLNYNNNLIKLVKLPKINVESRELFRFSVEDIKLPALSVSKIFGLSIERIIVSTLNAEIIDNRQYLSANKNKLRLLKYVARDLDYEPVKIDDSPIFIDANNNVHISEKIQKRLNLSRESVDYEIDNINKSLHIIREQIYPLIKYIKENILTNEKIRSQELVINEEYDVLSLCDLSTDNEVMEIKSFYDINNISKDADAYKKYLDRIKNQLFVESNNRKCYLLMICLTLNDSSEMKYEFILKEIDFQIINSSINSIEDKRQKAKDNVQKNLGISNYELINYVSSKDKVTIKCKRCGYERFVSYNTALNRKVVCKNCSNKDSKTQIKSNIVEKSKLTNKKLILQERTNNEIVNEKLLERGKRYVEKINKKSEDKLYVDYKDYKGSKERIRVKCLKCGCIWNPRADHLLERCYCPECRVERKSIFNNLNQL